MRKESLEQIYYETRAGEEDAKEEKFYADHADHADHVEKIARAKEALAEQLPILKIEPDELGDSDAVVAHHARVVEMLRDMDQEVLDSDDGETLYQYMRTLEMHMLDTLMFQRMSDSD